MADNEVTLREYLETRICALDRVFTTKLDSMDEALKLQAAEYERRLETLNNAAARVDAATNAGVKADICLLRHKDLDTKIGDLQSSRDKTVGRDTILSALVALGVSVAILLFNYLVLS